MVQAHLRYMKGLVIKIKMVELRGVDEGGAASWCFGVDLRNDILQY